MSILETFHQTECLIKINFSKIKYKIYKSCERVIASERCIHMNIKYIFMLPSDAYLHL